MMATAEDIRGQIAAAHQTLQQEKERTSQLLGEVERAKERQILRDELLGVQTHIAECRKRSEYHKWFVTELDEDLQDGLDHDPHGGDGGIVRATKHTNANRESLNCSEGVVKGEYEWRVEGMSWLVNALKQEENDFVDSDCFIIGGESFDLVYNPNGGSIGVESTHECQMGSLAIRHLNGEGITFRYRLFVKETDGNVTQWGEVGDECHPSWEDFPKAFGPDVQMVESNYAPSRPIGIFGLDHKALLESKWIQHDTLTVKVQVEVRPPTQKIRSSKLPIKPHVDVPPATLHTNLLSLLESGKCSDVTFIVEGERLKAHAAILSVRSEVFDRQLNGGMSESVSREVVILDCDIVTFKILLQFLYTDDFSAVENALKLASANAPFGGTAGSGNSMSIASVHISIVQSILAVSHKYQVQRLQLWCEQKLCECISLDDVCSILCQAHLYEAKQLQQACLTFIKENMDAVVVTPTFGSLSAEWPEVMLKINIFVAGVSESGAAQAIKAQSDSRQKRQLQASGNDEEEGGGKRKRDE